MPLFNIKKPDLKAPRAKTGQGYCPIDRSLWRKFKKSTGVDCTYQEFSKVIKTSNEVITDVVCYERDGFKLLNDIGQLIIVAGKPIAINYDYTKLDERGILTRHSNLHTEGKTCHIVYSTYCVRDFFLNRKLWSFEPVRAFTRKASHSFVENYSMFRVVMDFEKSRDDEKKVIKQIEDEDYIKTYTDAEHPEQGDNIKS